MRKKFHLKANLVFLFFFASFLFYGFQIQTEEDKSIKEFNLGQTSKYSTLGLGKSQGLKIHFNYPKSWEAVDGERPHIVKKIVQPGGTVMAIIQIVQLDFESTQSEINQFFSNELQLMYPDYKIISVNNNMRIEGLRCGTVECTKSAIRANQNIYSHNFDFVTFYKNYQFSILFMVVDKVGESKEIVNDRFNKLKPLFSQMINSIVIDNIWEK
jgi:hypothetical protein